MKSSKLELCMIKICTNTHYGTSLNFLFSSLPFLPLPSPHLLSTHDSQSETALCKIYVIMYSIPILPSFLPFPSPSLDSPLFSTLLHSLSPSLGRILPLVIKPVNRAKCFYSSFRIQQQSLESTSNWYVNIVGRKILHQVKSRTTLEEKMTS